MSQLPKSSQDLIDDCVNLSVSLSKIAIGFVEDLKFRVAESSKVAEKAMEAVREKKEIK
ncbi:MAG: hypothetical protein MK033_05265 [Candidatus Caenarcaniphilales bacterium]|nr:hypothetical protein [Candidatus Caenarcaniphilales bacterium]